MDCADWRPERAKGALTVLTRAEKRWLLVIAIILVLAYVFS